VEKCELRIDPAPNDYTNGTDSFGNTRSYFSIFSPHERLRVEASSRLRVRDRNPDLDPAASPRLADGARFASVPGRRAVRAGVRVRVRLAVRSTRAGARAVRTRELSLRAGRCWSRPSS